MRGKGVNVPLAAPFLYKKLSRDGMAADFTTGPTHKSNKMKSLVHSER